MKTQELFDEFKNIYNQNKEKISEDNVHAIVKIIAQLEKKKVEPSSITFDKSTFLLNFDDGLISIDKDGDIFIAPSDYSSKLCDLF